MPTLIRLFIFLLVLAGLVFGGMVALTVVVDPGEKDITIKIPPRDLVATPENDPLGIKPGSGGGIDLPAPVAIIPDVPNDVTPDDSGSEATATGTMTVEPGQPE